ERLVAAAAENAHGLSHRLALGLDRRAAGGGRGIARAPRRPGGSGFELGHAARHLVKRLRIGGRRRCARGEVAQLELDAGDARIERAHAVVAAEEQAHEPEHGEHEAAAGDRRTEPGHLPPRPPGRPPAGQRPSGGGGGGGRGGGGRGGWGPPRGPRAWGGPTPLSGLRNRPTSPSTASTGPPPATAAPSPDTCRRGASGGALAGTS